MLRKYAALVATMAVLAPQVPGALLPAQVPAAHAQQQQMQRMQEQVQRLNETVQRMTRIQERAHSMEQLMLRDMERLRMQEQLQLQDQERLRHQEQIRTMAHSLGVAAGEMTQAMHGLRQMAQDPGGALNREMEQDMERLRQHMQETSDQMEAGLRVMEQLRERLNES